MSLDQFADEAMADLHDEDIRKIGEIYREMLARFAHKTNNQQNISEMCKWAEDTYYKAGYKVGFDLTGVLLGVPPTMSVLGKVHPEYDFDHDKKRWEVVRANERGEKYLGETGK